MSAPRLESWYRLDESHRIVELGGIWSAAADGEGLKPDLSAFVGTRLFDHVSGHFTRRFLKEFFDRARASGEQTRSTYRCDSPRSKILVEMRAQWAPTRGLLVTHWTLDERPLPFPIALREAPKRAAATISRCSICNRVRPFSRGPWREPESSAKPGETLSVIHTVCLDCRTGISARTRWDMMHPA